MAKCPDCPPGPRRCAPCNRAYQARRRAGAVQPRPAALTAEETKAYHAEYYRRNREKWRQTTVSRYGLTLEEYDALWSQQGGVCCLCGGLDPAGRSLAVDHDHETGEVRGLLCGPCNIGVGCFQDRADVLQRAADYVARTGVRA